ncbi:hypothetical protein Tco_0322358 [Tanacetum coccineum]
MASLSSKVVGGILLSADELLRVEKLAQASKHGKRRQARVVKQETASKSRQARVDKKETGGKQETAIDEKAENTVKECTNWKDKRKDKKQEALLISEDTAESKQEDQNTLARNKKVNQPSFDQCTNHQDKKKKQERSQKGDAFSPERQRDDISKKERKKERGIVIKDKKGHIGS